MPGAFEHSDGGMLFIDEIEHLPISVQGPLVKAFRTRSFCRMGGYDRLHVNHCLVLISALPSTQPGQEDIFIRNYGRCVLKNELCIPLLPLKGRRILFLWPRKSCACMVKESAGQNPASILLCLLYWNPTGFQEIFVNLKRCFEGRFFVLREPILTSLDFYPENVEKESPQDRFAYNLNWAGKAFRKSRLRDP